MTAPIFLIGAPRSGTTLLVEVLNRHQDVFVFNETVFYDAVANVDAAGQLDHAARLEQLVEHFCRRIDARLRAEEQEGEDFGGRFTADEAAGIKARFRENARALVERRVTYPELLSLFMETVCQLKGKRVWGEKTPNHVFQLGNIQRDFPGARFVNVVREPSAFVISYKFSWRQRGGFEANQYLYHPLVTALQWRRSVKHFDQFLKDSCAGHCLSIRYEDLVENMQESVEQICAFLQIEPMAGPLEIRGSNTSFSGKRERLSRYEQGICSAVCGRLASANGYAGKAGAYDYLMLILSCLSLPVYAWRVIPIMRARFGGSFIRYLRARNIIPGGGCL